MAPSTCLAAGLILDMTWFSLLTLVLVGCCIHSIGLILDMTWFCLLTLVLVGVQTVESSLQHKVDMVSRLEQKTAQMAATIRDMEEGSVSHMIYYSLIVTHEAATYKKQIKK